MRVYEVTRPLRDQVETAKSDVRFLTESKAAVAKELAQVKDALASRNNEKNKLTKSGELLERKLQEAEALLKRKEFKKVRTEFIKDSFKQGGS